jgi:hypothetical protein
MLLLEMLYTGAATCAVARLYTASLCIYTVVTVAVDSTRSWCT